MFESKEEAHAVADADTDTFTFTTIFDNICNMHYSYEPSIANTGFLCYSQIHINYRHIFSYKNPIDV